MPNIVIVVNMVALALPTLLHEPNVSLSWPLYQVPCFCLAFRVAIAKDYHRLAYFPSTCPQVLRLTSAALPLSPVPTASNCRSLASLVIPMDKLWTRARNK